MSTEYIWLLMDSVDSRFCTHGNLATWWTAHIEPMLCRCMIKSCSSSFLLWDNYFSVQLNEIHNLYALMRRLIFAFIVLIWHIFSCPNSLDNVVSAKIFGSKFQQ